MPYIIDIYRGGHVLGMALDREQDDAFWRPYLLAEAATPDVVAAKPNPLISNEPRGRVPDILDRLDTWILRERVKAIVEGLEPGVHYFLPLHVVSEKSRKDIRTFYAMRIQQLVDAIVPEGTDYQQGMGRKGFQINNLISLLGTAARIHRGSATSTCGRVQGD